MNSALSRRSTFLLCLSVLSLALLLFSLSPATGIAQGGEEEESPLRFPTPTPAPRPDWAAQSADEADAKDEGWISPVCAVRSEDQQRPFNLSFMSSTACVGGMAGTYPCNNVDLLSFLPLSAIGGGSGNDIWGWTDSTTGKEYAIMGRTTGTAFVDISDPENPVYLGNLPAHNNVNSTWRDIKVYADHAYIVSEASNHGMQVFDLTQLRTVSSPPKTFTETTHYGGGTANLGSSHNLVINEDSGYGYIVGGSGSGKNNCSGGLHMVDLRIPAAPTFAGCFSDDGYTHDAQCVIYNGPDLEHVGKEICLAPNEDTLTIVDVSDKSNPEMLSRTGYAGCTGRSNCYTHQGWLTEDQSHYLIDDELDEDAGGLPNTRTYIWDVANLDQPQLQNTYDSGVAAIDHNLYSKGHSIYQANYRAGLRILDAQDVDNGNLSEVAFFDVYPSDNNPEFNGAWSNYPYFQSDVVIVSGIEQGLFVLQPTLPPEFTLDLADVNAHTLDICQSGSNSVEFVLDDVYGYSDNVTMSVAEAPSGITSSWSSPTVAVPGRSTLTIGGGSAAPGAYRVAVEATDGALTHREYLRLNLSGPSVAPALAAPLNGSTRQGTQPTLSWAARADGITYQVEVASDPTFATIVASASGLRGTSYTVPTPLAEDTIYYWRVRTVNGCGTSTPSQSFAFRTATLSCTTYSASAPEVPAPILSTVLPATSDLTVSGSGTILDLNVVGLQGTHAYMGDIDFALRSPAGTSVKIMGRSCGSTDNFDLNLDDEAAGTWPCPPVGGGTYQPSSALAAFDDQSGNGTWTLTVTDYALTDDGILQGWGLEICSAAPTASPPDYSDLPASYGIASHSGDGALRLGSTWSGDEGFGDGSDSDDGVTIDTSQAGWQPGGNAVAEVTITGGSGYLAAWFDWNGDGTFDNSGGSTEKVFGGAVTAGSFNMPIAIPAGADTSAPINARFRLYPSEPTARAALGSESPYGAVSGGEVEDITTNGAPLAVTLASFGATVDGTEIHVTWESVAETDLAGFHLRRSTRNADRGERITGALIPAQAAGSGQGASYQWRDADVTVGTEYFYWLESIDGSGTSTLHGPVAATVTATPTALLLGQWGAQPAPAVPWAALALLGLLALGMLRRTTRR